MMTPSECKSTLFDALSSLYEYPADGGYAERIAAFREQIAEEHANSAAALATLEERTKGLAGGLVEELYTRTFDINAICSLEVGWHIYGEEYARGALLVRFRGELRRLGIPESPELPDHLTHVLRLIGRLRGEKADDLAGRYLLPALGKMLSGMQGKDSPYEVLLRTTQAIIQREHPDAQLIAPQARRPEAPDSKARLPLYGPQPPQNNTCGGFDPRGARESQHGVQ